MNRTPPAASAFALSRRAFARSLAFAGAALALVPSAFHATSIGGRRPATRLRGPVVSFHMDRLFVDHTGAATPYVSPAGMRSAEPLAHLSEEAFRRAQPYV
ncbi:MAG: hypothetical protein KGL02_09990 [Acidobacteriota bacterium]|nr:hypothetical protein [Acidobacteriota bacterium]MDE3168948.1 hypothetical protein [Acidobacteriota bacterium]